jgi:hypothetical protein
MIGMAMKTTMKTTVTAMAMKVSWKERMTRKSDMNRRRKIGRILCSTWIPPIQRTLCIPSTIIMRWPSLILMVKVTVHPLHGQSILSGMGNPNGCQIGTKVNTSET